MGKPDEPYYTIIVETFRISGSGLHGDIHVRPIAGERFPQTMHVRSPKEMRRKYPVGNSVRIYAKLTDREGGKPFLHTHHNWDYKVLE